MFQSAIKHMFILLLPVQSTNHVDFSYIKELIMATIEKMSEKAKKLRANLTINEDNFKAKGVTLAGKTYTDITSTDKPVGNA